MCCFRFFERHRQRLIYLKTSRLYIQNVGMNELQKLLIEFPSEKWDFHRLIQNPNITYKFLKKHIYMFKHALSVEYGVVAVLFYSHTDLLIYAMSSNPNITIDFIKYNINKKWCWGGCYGISANPNVTLNFIRVMSC
jgi:hypothetical protein